MFTRIWISSFLIVFFGASNLLAVTLDGRCAIKFYAESTLHDFEGQAACQPFTLQTEPLANSREVLRQPQVTVVVKEMDTDHSGRDEKMRTMFDSEHFPVITGLFADLDPELVLQQLQQDEQGPGTLEFELRIRDIAQHVKAKTSDLTVTDAQITFTVEFPLSLSSYALEPPSVLGMIKVDDQVRVVSRVILSRRPDSQN